MLSDTPCPEGPGQPGASPPPLPAAMDPAAPGAGQVGRDSRGWAAHAPSVRTAGVPAPGCPPLLCSLSNAWPGPGPEGVPSPSCSEELTVCVFSRNAGPRGDLVTGRASGRGGGRASHGNGLVHEAEDPGTRPVQLAGHGAARAAGRLSPAGAAAAVTLRGLHGARPARGSPVGPPRSNRHLGACGITRP